MVTRIKEKIDKKIKKENNKKRTNKSKKRKLSFITNYKRTPRKIDPLIGDEKIRKRIQKIRKKYDKNIKNKLTRNFYTHQVEERLHRK